MVESRQRSTRLLIRLVMATLTLGGSAVGLWGLRISRAHMDRRIDNNACQVTSFGVVATPGGKTTDLRLVTIKTQLDKLLPKHGFRFLDAQSKRIVPMQSVSCKLDNQYTIITSLIQAVDENGKVQLRCELLQDHTPKFSTLVKTPLNQLFFCQHPLHDGSQLLIGVGAR
jgi:hypothetical protein